MRKCSACNGTGQYCVLCAMRKDGRGGPAMLHCFDCNGTGTDTRPEAWITGGQEARRRRIARDQSIREAATRLGVSPVDISSMERGRVDPAPLLAILPEEPGAPRG